MSDKSHEWIVISDLMAGMMAVVVLFLVFSVLDKDAEQIQFNKTIEKLKLKSQKSVSVVFKSLGKVIHNNGLANTVKLSVKSSTMTFTDGVFANGSACLTSNVIDSVKQMRPYIVNFLEKNPLSYVMVQGYTNNVPIGSAVIDEQKYCAVYDDNITLSAARANAVRKLIVSVNDGSIYRHVIVAAYGDSKPLPGLSPANGHNRRVNVRFVTR